MIYEPQGYKNAEANTGGASRKLPAGNYKCAICNAEVGVSKKGNNMLILTIDIAGGEYDCYFNTKYMKNLNYGGDVKWDNGGMYYQLIDGEHVGRFKGLLEMLVSTNNLGEITFPFDEKRLIGCYFAGQFRDEEYESNGNINAKAKLNFINPVSELANLPLLEPKKLQTSTYGTGRTGFSTNGFNAQKDEDIPF